jgi:flagellar protein FliS
MMTTHARGAEQYRSTQVRSSTPLELIVLLYDGALRSMTLAHDAMQRKDIPARQAELNRAQAIVAELQNTLDLERGGAVAAELDRLYTWVLSQLTTAILEQDARPIEQARRVFETLADAWRTVAAGPQPQTAP